MQKASNIAVLVGSLRKGSCPQRLAQVLSELAPRSLRLELVEISRLAVYDAGLDRHPPPEWRLFRQQIRAADGVLFLAPACPRRVPGVLANALNIASHPAGSSVWEGKPCGVVSVSASGSSRFESHRRLRQALALLNVPVMTQPDALIDDAVMLFDAAGRLIHPMTRRLLAGFIGAFDDWVRLTARH